MASQQKDRSVYFYADVEGNELEFWHSGFAIFGWTEGRSTDSPWYSWNGNFMDEEALVDGILRARRISIGILNI